MTPAALDALVTAAVPPVRGLRDNVLHVDTVFSLGFMKPFPKFVFGSSNKAFGTPGAGGSFGMADPDTGTGFGYVMNRMGFHPWSDPRELNLRHTCSTTFLALDRRRSSDRPRRPTHPLRGSSVTEPRLEWPLSSHSPTNPTGTASVMRAAVTSAPKMA